MSNKTNSNLKPNDKTKTIENLTQPNESEMKEKK